MARGTAQQWLVLQQPRKSLQSQPRGDVIGPEETQRGRGGVLCTAK